MSMKKLIIISIALLCCLTMVAGSVTERAAREKATTGSPAATALHGETLPTTIASWLTTPMPTATMAQAATEVTTKIVYRG